MPNPSELARLHEERYELIALIKSDRLGKSDKEYYLSRLRSLEKQLSTIGQPYNSSAFGGDDGEGGR